MGGDLAFSLDDISIESKDVDLNKNPEEEKDESLFTDVQGSASEEESQAGEGQEAGAEETDDNTGDNTTDDSGAEREEDENNDGEQSSQEEESPSSDKDSSQKSTLYALAQHLKEEGVLFIDDEIDKVESLDDLKELIGKSNQQARYANLTESQRRYHDALENGVPVSEFEKIEKQIQTFSGVDQDRIASDVNTRYEILAIDMMDQGMEKEKALKFAKLSAQDESSVKEAQEALSTIIERRKTQAKELVDTAKNEKQTTIDDYKKNIFEKEKILDAKINDTTKNKLFDLITTKVESDEEGRPLNELQKWQRENPVESSVMMNYLYMMTNKGKDLKMFMKKGTTEASKDLEKKLKQNLNFDENGSLIIPDSMMGGGSSKQNSNSSNKNKPQINI